MKGLACETTCEAHPFQGGGGGGGGGVIHIGAVSRAATGVKMQSNSQGTFWGSVKRSSSVLGALSAVLLAIKRRVRSFAHAQLSMVKGQSGVVKRLRSLFDGQKS